MALNLSLAGIKSYDVRTARGAYAGLIAWNKSGDFYRVYFDSNGNRGSAKKFVSVEDATAYIVDRRLKKGWSI